jgi:hypothetical protein
MTLPRHRIAFDWDNTLDLAANAIAGSWRIPVPTTVLADYKWELRCTAPMRSRSNKPKFYP